MKEFNSEYRYILSQRVASHGLESWWVATNGIINILENIKSVYYSFFKGKILVQINQIFCCFDKKCAQDSRLATPQIKTINDCK